MVKKGRDGKNMAMSEAKKRANARYIAKNYESIPIKYPRGTRAKIHVLATKAGESMAGYILKAVKERAARDGIEWDSIGTAELGGTDDTEPGGDM